MGVIKGPFDAADWYTMGQLKLDLEFSRQNLKKNPDFPIAEKFISNKLREYFQREAA